MADENKPNDEVGNSDDGFEATPDTNDGSSGEGIEARFMDISEDLEKALCEVKDKMEKRDLVSNRMQVRDAWEQRYFDRGSQHLVEGPYGQWGFLGENTVATKSAGSEDRIDETNIYQAYRLQLAGILTQNNPAVRFFPVDNKKQLDNKAAAQANKLKKIIERENKMIKLQSDIVRLLYTDGTVLVVCEFDDKQKKQRLEAVGVLEAKIPIQQNEVIDMPYCIIAKEQDIVSMKNKYKSVAKQIKPSTAPAAESEYRRLARVSVMQGMRPAAMTGDSLLYNVTEQKTWLKVDCFCEITNEELREEALEAFPEGVCLYHCGSTFCGARPARMDDELTLIFAIDGDGTHRNSVGKSLVNVQKKFNNAVELMQQTLMNTIPVKWTHPSYVDLPALAQQKNLPGSYLKLAAIPPNGDLSNAFYVEEQMEPPMILMQWIQELRDNFAQLLTGAYPALTGAGDLGGNDTAQGIAVERDAAMGRIGSIWRSIKEGYASIMHNAVMCVVANREGTISANLPARGGMMQSVTVDVDDLRGNVVCYAETEEAFPESWVQKRGIYMSLMSSPDPKVEETANLPENLVIAKELIGVEDYYIPQIVSRNKQLTEITKLLQEEPQPNPQIVQIQNQLVQAALLGHQNPALQPQIEQAVQEAQQQIATLPPLVSSISVNVDWDDHLTESQTCGMFINSEDGQEAAETIPQGFKNVELHGMEHKKALAAASAGAPQKPVSVSLSLGDLLKANMLPEAAQLLAKAGITEPGGGAPPSAAAPGASPMNALGGGAVPGRPSPNPSGMNAPGLSPVPVSPAPIINPKPLG